MPRKGGPSNSGTNGNDILDGLGPSVRLMGGRGDDTYLVDDLGDRISEKNNGGHDHVISQTNWTLGAHLEDLTLAEGNAALGTGNSLDNKITGNSLENTLSGAAGNDTLIGGSGEDLLDGGDGDDWVVFDGARSEYSFEWVGNDLRVTSLTSGETDTLRDVEYVLFADGFVLTSDLGGAPPPPPLPEAIPDHALVSEDGSIDIGVAQNDIGSNIGVKSVGAGALGAATLNNDGTVRYVPHANAQGMDNFTYTITDEFGQSTIGTVTVEVMSVNDVPVAADDFYSLDTGTAAEATGNVTDNDDDVDGDPLSVVGVGQNLDYIQSNTDVSGHFISLTAAGGQVHVAPDGSFDYTPLDGFSGTDSFSYALSDGAGGSATATVYVDVIVPDPTPDPGPPPPNPEEAPYYVTGVIAGGTARLNYPDEVGSSVEVTYAFLTDVPAYYLVSSEDAGFEAFSLQQQEATRSILRLIESFSNITFVETSVEEATITFGMADLGGVNGSAYEPNGDSVWDRPGDVWIDAAFGGDVFTLDSPQFAVLIHEIGHAIGLRHPDLPDGEENYQHTVMAAAGHPTHDAGGNSYQLYDVAGLQYLYGENTEFSTGDDVYGFADLVNLNHVIWDAGGNDTLDMSDATHSVTLSLEAGSFSTITSFGELCSKVGDGLIKRLLEVGAIRL